MDTERLRELLTGVQAGDVPIEAALSALRSLPYEDLGFAKVDHHRALRVGFPEVVYCPGKTTEQILAILEKLTAHAPKILASRATPEVAAEVLSVFPHAVYHESARMLVVPGQNGRDLSTISEPDVSRNDITGTQAVMEREIDTSSVLKSSLGLVLVVSAGTADMPVAEEAAVTASEMGSPVERLYDVGVAGIHRLLDKRERLTAANVVIVVAGMEGALASVVGGLVSRPVIAVPTSIGYGASFQGLSALLTMLNSCATGIGVVNIDNGFGAGYLAHLINK